MSRNDDLLNQALKTEQAGCRKDDTQCCGKCQKSMSREKFEYEAGKALNLPTNIIELARKGDGYDHAFDSMNIMQPLKGWWHWWKAGAASMQSERDHLAAQLKQSQIDVECYKRGMDASNKLLADVVAENAALQFYLRNGPVIRKDGELAAAHQFAPAAPATDRFLAEQRAIGAELCVKALITSDDDDFVDAPNICANVAAQLRNEVKI